MNVSDEDDDDQKHSAPPPPPTNSANVSKAQKRSASDKPSSRRRTTQAVSGTTRLHLIGMSQTYENEQYSDADNNSAYSYSDASVTLSQEQQPPPSEKLDLQIEDRHIQPYSTHTAFVYRDVNLDKKVLNQSNMLSEPDAPQNHPMTYFRGSIVIGGPVDCKMNTVEEYEYSVEDDKEKEWGKHFSHMIEYVDRTYGFPLFKSEFPMPHRTMDPRYKAQTAVDKPRHLAIACDFTYFTRHLVSEYNREVNKRVCAFVLCPTSTETYGFITPSIHTPHITWGCYASRSIPAQFVIQLCSSEFHHHYVQHACNEKEANCMLIAYAMLPVNHEYQPDMDVLIVTDVYITTRNIEVGEELLLWLPGSKGNEMFKTSIKNTQGVDVVNCKLTSITSTPAAHTLRDENIQWVHGAKTVTPERARRWKTQTEMKFETQNRIRRQELMYARFGRMNIMQFIHQASRTQRKFLTPDRLHALLFGSMRFDTIPGLQDVIKKQTIHAENAVPNGLKTMIHSQLNMDALNKLSIPVIQHPPSVLTEKVNRRQLQELTREIKAREAEIENASGNELYDADDQYNVKTDTLISSCSATWLEPRFVVLPMPLIHHEWNEDKWPMTLYWQGCKDNRNELDAKSTITLDEFELKVMRTMCSFIWDIATPQCELRINEGLCAGNRPPNVCAFDKDHYAYDGVPGQQPLYNCYWQPAGQQNVRDKLITIRKIGIMEPLIIAVRACDIYNDHRNKLIAPAVSGQLKRFETMTSLLRGRFLGLLSWMPDYLCTQLPPSESMLQYMSPSSTSELVIKTDYNRRLKIAKDYDCLQFVSQSRAWWFGNTAVRRVIIALYQCSRAYATMNDWRNVDPSKDVPHTVRMMAIRETLCMYTQFRNEDNFGLPLRVFLFPSIFNIEQLSCAAQQKMLQRLEGDFCTRMSQTQEKLRRFTFKRGLHERLINTPSKYKRHWIMLMQTLYCGALGELQRIQNRNSERSANQLTIAQDRWSTKGFFKHWATHLITHEFHAHDKLDYVNTWARIQEARMLYVLQRYLSSHDVTAGSANGISDCVTMERVCIVPTSNFVLDERTNIESNGAWGLIAITTIAQDTRLQCSASALRVIQLTTREELVNIDVRESDRLHNNGNPVIRALRIIWPGTELMRLHNTATTGAHMPYWPRVHPSNVISSLYFLLVQQNIRFWIDITDSLLERICPNGVPSAYFTQLPLDQNAWSSYLNISFSSLPPYAKVNFNQILLVTGALKELQSTHTQRQNTRSVQLRDSLRQAKSRINTIQIDDQSTADTIALSNRITSVCHELVSYTNDLEQNAWLIEESNVARAQDKISWFLSSYVGAFRTSWQAGLYALHDMTSGTRIDLAPPLHAFVTTCYPLPRTDTGDRNANERTNCRDVVDRPARSRLLYLPEEQLKRHGSRYIVLTADVKQGEELVREWVADMRNLSEECTLADVNNAPYPSALRVLQAVEFPSAPKLASILSSRAFDMMKDYPSLNMHVHASMQRFAPTGPSVLEFMRRRQQLNYAPSYVGDILSTYHEGQSYIEDLIVACKSIEDNADDRQSKNGVYDHILVANQLLNESGDNLIRNLNADDIDEIVNDIDNQMELDNAREDEQPQQQQQQNNADNENNLENDIPVQQSVNLFDVDDVYESLPALSPDSQDPQDSQNTYYVHDETNQAEQIEQMQQAQNAQDAEDALLCQNDIELPADAQQVDVNTVNIEFASLQYCDKIHVRALDALGLTCHDTTTSRIMLFQDAHQEQPLNSFKLYNAHSTNTQWYRVASMQCFILVVPVNKVSRCVAKLTYNNETNDLLSCTWYAVALTWMRAMNQPMSDKMFAAFIRDMWQTSMIASSDLQSFLRPMNEDCDAEIKIYLQGKHDALSQQQQQQQQQQSIDDIDEEPAFITYNDVDLRVVDAIQTRIQSIEWIDITIDTTTSAETQFVRFNVYMQRSRIRAEIWCFAAYIWQDYIRLMTTQQDVSRDDAICAMQHIRLAQRMDCIRAYLLMSSVLQCTLLNFDADKWYKLFVCITVDDRQAILDFIGVQLNAIDEMRPPSSAAMSRLHKSMLRINEVCTVRSHLLHRAENFMKFRELPALEPIQQFQPPVQDATASPLNVHYLNNHEALQIVRGMRATSPQRQKHNV